MNELYMDDLPFLVALRAQGTHMRRSATRAAGQAQGPTLGRGAYTGF